LLAGRFAVHGAQRCRRQDPNTRHRRAIVVRDDGPHIEGLDRLQPLVARQ
jgi:hypothetical protein